VVVALDAAVAGPTDWEVTDTTGSRATLVVANRSTIPICSVQVAPIAAGGELRWSENLLGAVEAIPPGQDRAFAVTAGSYTLRASYSGFGAPRCAGEYYFQHAGQSVFGRTVWTLRQEQTATLDVVNRTGGPICYIRVAASPSGQQGQWGPDLLGASETVAAGAQRRFQLDEGTYDVRAEDCSMRAVEQQFAARVAGAVRWEVTGGSGGGVAGGPAGGPSGGTFVELVNDSGQPIFFVMIAASPAGQRGQWGADRLGSDEIVPSGATRRFDLAPGTYDFRAEGPQHQLIAQELGASIQGGVRWTITQ
jgi:hypothetical protein